MDRTWLEQLEPYYYYYYYYYYDYYSSSTHACTE